MKWTSVVFLVLLSGCCPIRAIEVGVLTGMGLYTPQQKAAAMAEIHRDCQQEKTVSRDGLRCWYASPNGSLECEHHE